MTQPLTVGRLFDRMRDVLELEKVGVLVGFDREVRNPEVSSPGLVLAGYVERFVGNRMQVLGETEVSYLYSLEEAERRRRLELFCSFDVPAIFVTKGQDLPGGLEEAAAGMGIPLMRSKLKTNEFYRRIKPYLEVEFAPSTAVHGSLADVFGVGLLFVGASGIGKSECVLDLVERGHRLVADDLVMVHRRGNDVLIGTGREGHQHFMEIRGVGLVDVPAIFGVRASRQQKRIEVVVQLEPWEQGRVVDRTGLDGQTTDILGVALPKITVLLNAGKNITVIAEVIALNHLLRYSGYDPAERFNARLIKRMREATAAASQDRAADLQRYLQEDNE